MPSSMEVLERISTGGLIAVVRAENDEQALKITEACMKGGTAAIEITFTVPGAAKVIERLAGEFKGSSILVGAGTALDHETARIAILAGAQFVVSPYLNTDTVKLCNRYDIACIPGAMTIREVVEAMETGAKMVKAFPGEVLGPAFIKAVRGPIPHARLCPTGGVSLENVDQWIKAGSAAVGVGGNLTAGARTGDYESVTRIAKDFMEKIQAARQ